MPRPIHFEVHAGDMDRAQSFYEAVLGWKFENWSDGNYRLIRTGDDQPGIDGGMIQRLGEDPEVHAPVNAWVCTVDVDNADRYVALAEAHGGMLVLPKMAIAGVGWLAYVKDTEGNILGLMQADKGAA
jgi:uncharacterized protein